MDFSDLAKLQERQYTEWEKQQDVIDRVLLRAYKEAYDETVAQIAALYAKVGEENVVDGVFIKKENAIRYNQLANRLDNLKTEMLTLRNKGIKLTEENSTQSIQDAYYSSLWSYDQVVGVNIGIPALPVDAIRAAVYSDDSGLTFIQTWNKNTTDAIYKTQAEIIRGITQGYSYTKMARAIKDQFDKGLWQAMRVIRTEAGRCWSNGAEEAHNAGIKAGLELRKRWSASLDRRTRADHGHLDGTYADDKGLFYLDGVGAPQPRTFGLPGQDINCRCAVYDVLDGIEPSVRRIRDEGIVPYVKFDDWAKDKGYDPIKGWPKIS